MLYYVKDGFFTSPAQVLVNTVNTMGVMGRGLAKEFREIFPEMYDSYRNECKSGALGIGNLHLFRTTNKWILNFPTKRHWKYRSDIDYIKNGLQTFSENYAKYGLTSVSFPQLGCGTGGLRWEEVRPVMEQYLAHLPLDIFVHVNSGGARDAEIDANRLKEWHRSELEVIAFQEWIYEIELLVNRAWLDPLGSEWTVNLSSEDVDYLTLSSDEECVRVAKSDIQQLWRTWQEFGYLILSDVQYLFGSALEAFDILMTRLPFANYAYLSRDITTLGNEDSRVIQLIPALLNRDIATQRAIPFNGEQHWIENQTQTK